MLLFTSTLEIYAVANWTLGSKLASLTFSNTPEPNLDVEVRNEVVLFSINNRLYLYNLTTQQYIL